MWIAVVGLFVTLLLVIIGMSIDILMVEDATGILSLDSITMNYGWQQVSWQFEYGNLYTNKTSITYANAYNTYCADKETTPSYCTDLKNIEQAGKLYIIFNIIGIGFLSASLLIAILQSLGKCLCACKCRVEWIVSILCMLAIVCFLIAFSVFLSDFSQNVNTLFNDITGTTMIWGTSSIGGSIGCLISASFFGFVALSCALCWYRRRAMPYANLNSSPGVIYGMPPPQMYASYGQPPYGQPPYGQQPYGQPPYGEPSYGQPVTYGMPPGPFTSGNTAPSGTYYQQVPQNTNMTPV